MPFKLFEIPGSRQSTSYPPSEIVRMRAVGESNDWIVRENVYGLTPARYLHQMGLLYRQDIKLDEEGFAQYLVTIPYGPRRRDTGQWTWGFDTSGATVHVKKGKAHVHDYPFDAAESEDVDQYEGAINVTIDREVEGTEIVVPALRLNFSRMHAAGELRLRDAKRLAAGTGFTNSDTWPAIREEDENGPAIEAADQFEPGELLFIGASGSDGSQRDAEVQYQVLASQNAEDLSMGTLTDIVKGGHHHLWVSFMHGQKTVGGVTRRVPVPERVNIERIYDPTSFADLFGWS